ncbi:MAG: CoA transferase [Candidatus Dadabacteria bacterium]|nr:MAG: CoA transferase [Candidatus Dadabacteria bacterium]
MSSEHRRDDGPPAALEGVRVLEIGQAESAYAGKLLADLGAEVVKLEPPEGCPTRRLAPLARAAGTARPVSLFFAYMNAGKRSVAMAADHRRSRWILGRLAAAADVVVDAQGLLDGLGVEPSPGLIHVSISGYGRSGPRAHWHLSDLVASALGGALYVTGEPQDPPTALACWQAYQSASLVAASAALVALRHQRRTGIGQRADVSIVECVAAVSHITGVGKWLDDGIVPVRNGTSLFASCPSGAYRCRDGLVYLMVNRPAHWKALAEWIREVTGIEEVCDPLFEGPSSQRIPYRDLLDRYIEALTNRLTVAEAFHEGQRRHIAMTPVASAAQVVSDPHLSSRGFFVELEEPQLARLRVPGPPYRHSLTPARIAGPVPQVGEHSAAVLAEWLGLARADFEELVRNGLVTDPGRICQETGGQTPRATSRQRPGDDRPSCAPAETGRISASKRAESQASAVATAGTGRSGPASEPGQAGETGERPPGALSGVRVVEFTAGMAGPWIGRYMAWCGAEVIRIESHARPDVVRLYVPPWAPERGVEPTMSPWFTDWNAGKRFLALDLTKPEAVEIAKRLVAISDVVIENYSTGVMDKLGLGYRELVRVRPDLVMLSTTGFGATGPYARYVTWGPNIEAASGLAALSGFPGRPCTITQYAYPDAISALHGLVAVLAALEYRRRTGRGQWIEIAQLEATAAMLGPLLAERLLTDREPGRLGNRSRDYAPQGCYPCRGEDRWCAITVRNEAEWQALCRVIGREDLGRDRSLARAEERRRQADRIDRAIEQWTRARDALEVAERLQAAGVAAAAVATVEDLYRDPQLRARGFFERIPHLTRGTVVATGVPLALEGTPGRSGRSGARVGEDNRYVLGELLGMNAEEIARAEASGAVEPPRPASGSRGNSSAPGDGGR